MTKVSSLGLCIAFLLAMACGSSATKEAASNLPAPAQETPVALANEVGGRAEPSPEEIDRANNPSKYAEKAMLEAFSKDPDLNWQDTVRHGREADVCQLGNKVHHQKVALEQMVQSEGKWTAVEMTLETAKAEHRKTALKYAQALITVFTLPLDRREMIECGVGEAHFQLDDTDKIISAVMDALVEAEAKPADLNLEPKSKTSTTDALRDILRTDYQARIKRLQAKADGDEDLQGQVDALANEAQDNWHLSKEEIGVRDATFASNEST